MVVVKLGYYNEKILAIEINDIIHLLEITYNKGTFATNVGFTDACVALDRMLSDLIHKHELNDKATYKFLSLFGKLMNTFDSRFNLYVALLMNSESEYLPIISKYRKLFCIRGENSTDQLEYILNRYTRIGDMHTVSGALVMATLIADTMEVYLTSFFNDEQKGEERVRLIKQMTSGTIYTDVFRRAMILVGEVDPSTAFDIADLGEMTTNEDIIDRVLSTADFKNETIMSAEELYEAIHEKANSGMRSIMKLHSNSRRVLHAILIEIFTMDSSEVELTSTVELDSMKLEMLANVFGSMMHLSYVMNQWI